LPIIQQIRVSTPLGFLIIQSRFDHIVKIFLDPDQQIFQSSSSKNSKEILSCLLLAKEQLEEYFQGTRKIFDLPYSLPVTKGFKRVYETLLHVPYGKTTSYAELAHQSGINKGARAVGCAMSKNPLPLIIPCHRVIRRNGSIGNYSLGGTENKIMLLQLEEGNVPKELI
jgi:methylated-DNA-[protein]-cysteine S-methyltransferase